jgi:mono/diheme cytochrome c family protein
MRRRRVVATGIALIVAAFAGPGSVRAQRPGSAATGTGAQPAAVLNQYCVTCHNQRLNTAGLALDTKSLEKVVADAEVWEKVVGKLRSGLMPPAGRPRPERAVVDQLATWLETELDRGAAASPNPGRTEAFHRLNRTEYQNAVRDLLAVEVDVTPLLPADDGSYGFDNIAGALRVNQSVIERYVSAAQKIARIAVGTAPPSLSIDEFAVSASAPQYDHVEGLPFGTRGGTLVRYTFPQDAEYVIKIALTCGPPAGLGVCDGAAGFDDAHQLEVLVDGERVQLFTLPRRPAGTLHADGWQVRTRVRAGPRDVVATFVKPPAIEETEWLRQRFERPIFLSNNINLVAATPYQPAVASVTITGPYEATGPGDTPSRRRIFACRPVKPAEEPACARKILSTLTRRAYRRPVTDADVQSLMRFFDQGRADGGFDAGIEAALQAMLVSPEFMFRIERDPDRVAPGATYPVTDLELASRLSFFLWSSIPDDDLLDLAAQKRLRDPAVLRQQVLRMLADPKSEALVKNFVGQWLQLRNLDAKRPSEPLFPDFDDGLREAFRKETALFFSSVIREDRSVLELLTADYTFVNERLARHYGIQNVKGSHFRRITFSDDRRRGLLGQGSVLLVTSHAIRTSPVLRGKWILTNILGTPPPDPPANVPPLKENSGFEKRARSVRDRMADHRANPVCAACHSMIDPAGFALENFDAVGRWRDVDEALQPIDAAGALPDGTKFSGLAEFRNALAAHPERFVRTLTERLLTYALGRGVTYYDAPAMRTVAREAAQNDYRFSSMILGIVNSLPFQKRRTALAPGLSAARH